MIELAHLGLRVGHAHDERLKSGASVVLPDEPAVAAIHVMGGAPGTRETDLLAPEQTVERVHAVVLSGGSAFGLDAAAGVQAWLAGKGRGFAIGTARVPVVPAAILFDLLNGGDKDWGRFPPYRELGFAAAERAAPSVESGSVGAGTGATTANLKGGFGAASTVLEDGATVAAFVAVNAVGRVTIGDGPHFWAAPFEVGNEFGGLGMPQTLPADATALVTKHGRSEAPTNTTIAVIATDATLSKAQAKRLAIMAHDGIARAVWPAHSPMDGDTVFVLSTEKRPLGDPVGGLVALGAAAAATLARAIALGVYSAAPMPGDTLPTWRERFG